MSEETQDQFTSVAEYIKFCMTPGSDPSKKQLSDSLFLTRQLFSLLFGIVAGLNGFTGLPIIIVYFLASLGYSHFYAFKFLQIDEDKVENMDVYTEALPPSIAIFFLSWTLSYTLQLL